MLTRIKKAIKILIGWREKPVRITISENDRIQAERVIPWFADNGDNTLRIDYDLNENSLVFDVGGYKGEFAATIHCKYGSRIFIFEPLQSFFQNIQSRFACNPKIQVFPFGLSGTTQKIEISLLGDASSIYGNQDKRQEIELVGILDFLYGKNLNISLMKLNIEGGEYDLLETLVNSQEITRIENIQVQFHDFLFEGAKERMVQIQQKLAVTHDLTYQYEFVWENWRRKATESDGRC